MASDSVSQLYNDYVAVSGVLPDRVKVTLVAKLMSLDIFPAVLPTIHV